VVDRRRVLLVLLVGATIVACKNKEAATAAPEAAGAASPGEGDPLAEPERALADNAAKLRSVGVALEGDAEDELDATEPANVAPAPPGNAKANELPAATRCDTLCQLADTACELRTQICDLAQDHVGESRYESACWRATDQCTRASAACEDCRGTTAGTADGC
jgi:hypothetical protein